MKNIYFLYSCLLLAFSLMLASAITTLPQTSFSVPNSLKETFSRVIPQGWSFFTRNPKEQLMLVYKIEGNDYHLAFHNNHHPSNLFGASRKSRRLAFEYSAYMQIAGYKEWTPHTGVDLQPIIHLPATHSLSLKKVSKNISPGKYMFVLQEPVPWAWLASFKKENTKSRYIIIDIVDCNDQLANK